MTENLNLKTRKMNSTDIGKGIVKISDESMAELNLTKGDAVYLHKEDKTAVARVYNYNKDPNISSNKSDLIFIDEEIKKNLKVDVYDKISIEKVDNVYIANSVSITITPPKGVFLQETNLGRRIKSELEKRVLINGMELKSDYFRIFQNIFNIPMTPKITVSKTDPRDQVVEVNRTTQINVSIENQPKGNTPPKGSPSSKRREVRGNNKRVPQQKQIHQQRSESHQEGQVPDVSYENIGGLNEELDKIREMVELPLKHPELFERLGIEPPKGLLLHGSPGTGKTLIAKAVANEVDANFFTISGPEIMSKYYGESEEKLREIFGEAEDKSPSIIFIDEIDAIAPSRGEATGGVDKRVVAQLLSLMDGLEKRENVVVIAATNRVDAVDSALRRGGRFDREIEIGVPDKNGRKEILEIHTREMPVLDEVNYDELAEKTHGFVGADIEMLAKEASMNSLVRNKIDINFDEKTIPQNILQEINVTKEDFNKALSQVEPSAMREFFIEAPDVTYEDVGGLDDVKKNLKETIEWPLTHKEKLNHFNTETAQGILLYGPPGNGKTLLAKAVANSSNSNFISVKGPELLNKYVGESEKGVREIFKKARQNAPAVIFFDELDAIATERGSGEASNQITERVVSQLLTELDGLEELENVKVIAATNRPDLIDSALLRSGRLSRQINTPLPEKEDRKEILKVHTKGTPLSDDIDYDELAEKTERYTGSDIEALTKEASLIAMRNTIENQENYEDKKVTMEHFEKALNKIEPSLTEENIEKYKQLSENMNNISPSDNKSTKGGMFR